MGEIVSTLIFEIDTRHTQEELDELEQKTTRLTEHLSAASESFKRFFQNASHMFSVSPNYSSLQENPQQTASAATAKNGSSFFTTPKNTSTTSRDSLYWDRSNNRQTTDVAPVTDSSSVEQAEKQSKNLALVEQAFNNLLSRLEQNLNRRESSSNIPFPKIQSDTWNIPGIITHDSPSGRTKHTDDAFVHRSDNIARTKNDDITQQVTPILQTPQGQTPCTINNPPKQPEHSSRNDTVLNDYFGRLLNRLAPFTPNNPKQEQNHQTSTHESNTSGNKSTNDRLQAEIPFESSLSDIKRLLERQTNEIVQQWKTTHQYLEKMTQANDDQTFYIEVRE